MADQDERAKKVDQINVRFTPDEMKRLREAAKVEFDGNASMLVRKAVRHIIADTEEVTEQAVPA